MNSQSIKFIEMVLDALLQSSGPPQIFSLTKPELKALFSEIDQQTEDARFIIVNNGDTTLIQFNQFRHHSIRVVS